MLSMAVCNKQPVLSAIQQAVETSPTLKRLCIAYSGGVDSHVLLHASRALIQAGTVSIPLRAVHINHQLQTQSPAWKRHCAAVCQQLGIDFTGIDVDASASTGQSPEEAAREARYAAINRQLCAGDALLTAHHRNDQAETVLLQMLRGSGVAGLAAMPPQQPRGEGVHLRPFLDLPQTVLADYADTHGLQWVEDPSNQATHYQRNYLRQTLWPLITARWPSADATLARVAHHSAEAAGLNATLANKDSEQVIDRDHCIHLASLLQLDAPRQRNVVRHWLKQASGRFPSQRLMQTLLTTVVNAKGDAQPAVQHDTLTVRRYRGRLYALPSLPTLPPHWSLVWQNTQQPLEIPALGLTLPVSLLSTSDDESLHKGRVEVTLRRGGETISLAGRPRKSLKALLQEKGVPPWQRSRSPLVYVDGVLVCIYITPDIIFFNSSENK